jgi:hypothetical protein
VSSVASAIPTSPPLPNTNCPLVPQLVSFSDIPPHTRGIGVSTSQQNGSSFPVMLSSMRRNFHSVLTLPVCCQALWTFLLQVLLHRYLVLLPRRHQLILRSSNTVLIWRTLLRIRPFYRLARSLPLPRPVLLQPALHLYGFTLGSVPALLHRPLRQSLHHLLHRLWSRRLLFLYSRPLLQLWRLPRHLRLLRRLLHRAGL